MTGHCLWPTFKISTKSIFLIVLTNQTTVPLHCTVLTSHLTSQTLCSPHSPMPPHSVGPLMSKTTLLPPTSTASHGQIRLPRMPRPPSKAPTPWARWSQLSAVPMSSTLAVLLVGMGPLPPHPWHIPLQQQ